MKLKLLLLIFALQTNFLSYAQVPAYVSTSSLVAWYPFNGNANDESGNGHNGTINGPTLSTDRFNTSNKAYTFSGNLQHISTNIVQTNISAYSVSMWFKSTIGGAMFQGSRSCSSGNGTRLLMYNTITAPGYKLLYASDGYGYTDGSESTNNYNDGNWHHVVGVWDGVGSVQVSPSQFTLYVDGALISQVPISSVGNGGIGGHPNIPISGSNMVMFGKETCNILSYSFQGALDDIAFWERAITPCEITQLYNASQFNPSIISSSSPTICTADTVILSSASLGTYTWSTGANTPSIVVSSQNTYSLFIKDGFCSGWSAPFNLTVNPNPTLSLVSTSTLICLGETCTLSAGGADTYTWQANTTNGSTISVNPTVTTVYIVKGTNTLTSCAASVAISQNVSECTGLVDENKFSEETILLFPNPSSSIISISGISNAEVTLYDQLGKQVRIFDLTEENLSFDISSLDKGFYFVEVKIGEEKMLKKIVKE